jgi:hypothetical protein
MSDQIINGELKKLFNRAARDGLCDALSLVEYAPAKASLEGTSDAYRAGFAAGRSFSGNVIRKELEKRRNEDGEI